MNIPLLILMCILGTVIVMSLVFYWLEYYFKWHRLLRYPNLDEVMYNIAICLNALCVVLIGLILLLLTVQTVFGV